MARYQRIDAGELPPKRNPAYNEARDAALKVARHKGAWCAVYHYPYTPAGENTANVRAQAVQKRNRSWQDVGTFETAVRADVNNWPYKWVVWVRCLDRVKPNGEREVFVQREEATRGATEAN